MENPEPTVQGSPAYTGKRPRIEVTQKHIDTAKRSVSSYCMISAAIKSSLPDAKAPQTDLQTIRFTNPKTGVRAAYLTPRVAQQALIDFDQGVEVKPFSFALRMAVQVSRSTGSGAKRRKSKDQKQGIAVVPGSKSRASLPVKIGGKMPPTAVLANTRGRVRRFGLRQLKP